MPFPFMAAAIAAAAGASAWGAHSANRESKRSSREQMAFQERMSSTAHQRQMQDMRQAGLNPVLSGKFGGSSTLSGASYNAQNEAEALPAAVTSAIGLRRLKAELNNMDAQNELLKRQAEQSTASARQMDAQTEVLRSSKLKEKATEPLYTAAGGVVKDMVSGHYPEGSIRAKANSFGRSVYKFFHK